MRRTIGLILVALGVGLLTLGFAFRFWAYPQVAVASVEYPTQADRDANLNPPAQDTVSTGKANFLVIDANATPTIAVKSLDLVSTRTTLGDVAAAKGNNVYYESRGVLTSPSMPGVKLNVSVDGICFDKVTGRAATTCARANYTAENEGQVNDNVSFEGQMLKFPFNTGRRDYMFYDGVLGKAVPIQFEAAESLDGLNVYRFSQTIPSTVLEGQEQTLPANLFGGSSSETVTAQQMYANTRTLWVEPETGAIIKGQEEQDRHFEASGQTVDILRGTLGYSEETVARNINAQKSNSSLLHLVRVVLMPLGLIGGLFLTLIGLIMTLSGRRSPEVVDITEQEHSLAAKK